MSEKGVYFYFVDARVQVVKHFIELGDLHLVASIAVIQVEYLFCTDAISALQGLLHPRQHKGTVNLRALADDLVVADIPTLVLVYS